MSKLRFILGEQKKSQKALKAFDSKWWKSQDCIGREETVGGETEFWSALSDEMGAFGDVKESKILELFEKYILSLYDASKFTYNYETFFKRGHNFEEDLESSMKAAEGSIGRFIKNTWGDIGIEIIYEYLETLPDCVETKEEREGVPVGGNNQFLGKLD